MLLKAGFQPVCEEWPSCFYHKAFGGFLVVCVDDYNMAAPSSQIPKAWAAIRQFIRTGDPEPKGRYLGSSCV